MAVAISASTAPIAALALAGCAPHANSTAMAPGVIEPALHTYVGQLSDTSRTKIVVLVSDHYAVAYASDNAHVGVLVGGKANSGSA